MTIILKIILGCTLMFISIKDLVTHKISNWSILILLIAGVGATWNQPLTLTNRILGMIIIGSPIIIIDILRPNSFGGGDIKLFMAAGTIFGVQGGIKTLCISFFTGGAYSTVMLITGQAKKSGKFPFGPFICTGIALCLFCVNS